MQVHLKVEGGPAQTHCLKNSSNLLIVSVAALVFLKCLLFSCFPAMFIIILFSSNVYYSLVFLQCLLFSCSQSLVFPHIF